MKRFACGLLIGSVISVAMAAVVVASIAHETPMVPLRVEPDDRLPVYVNAEVAPEQRELADVVDAGVVRRYGWTPTPAPLSVTLARVYFSESDGRSRADERLIYNVLRRVGGGRVTLEAARAYSGRASGIEPPGTARLRWVAELDAAGRQPPAWEGSAAYWREVVRPRWLRTLERARRDLASPPASPCRLTAHHWGGPMDDWRAERQRWVRADCGTRNRGWCAPEIGDCGGRRS